MSTRNRKKSGFARTKNYPHKKHPAKFHFLGNDEVEYITFTHHDEVELEGQIFKTIPLDNNIVIEERGKKKSYAFPRVFIGTRSALGKKSNDFNLTKKDKEKVNKLFKTLPKKRVPYSTNSKKKN